MRKFGYSEHCVYTGAMLSFIYSLFWFLGDSIVWERRFSGDAFSGDSYYGYFLEGFCFGDIVGISICRLAFLEERSFLEEYEKHWKCFVVRGVSEGNLFWFLELRGFETVSNGFYHVPCLPVR